MRNPPRRRRQCHRACPIFGFFAFVGRFWITWTRLCQNCSNKFDADQKRPEKPEQKLWKDQWIKAMATRDAHTALTANPSSRDVCANISLQPVTVTGTLPASSLISSKQFVRTKQNENLLKQLAAGAKKNRTCQHSRAVSGVQRQIFPPGASLQRLGAVVSITRHLVAAVRTARTGCTSQSGS